MKKFGFLLPIVLVVLFSMYGTRLVASGTISPTTMILVGFVPLVVLFLVRPKAAAPKPVSDIEKKIRGEFAKDAFADKPDLAVKFQAVLKDYSSNMPKAALSKLQKLAPQCSTDEETYAVAVATAMIHTTLSKPKDAIREYVRALNLHPTSETAHALASSYQRIGELDKAIDTYQYAIDLDSGNLEALSALATAYVADGSYRKGLNQAMLVLEKNETNASALATAAICYGLLDDPVMHKRYTELAVENGYKKDKIIQTVDALKKRK